MVQISAKYPYGEQCVGLFSAYSPQLSVLLLSDSITFLSLELRNMLSLELVTCSEKRYDSVTVDVAAQLTMISDNKLQLYKSSKYFQTAMTTNINFWQLILSCFRH